MQAYCDSVVGWCSDLGAESGVVDTGAIDMEAVLRECTLEANFWQVTPGPGVPPLPMLPPPPPPPPPSETTAGAQKLFRKALYIPGMKHLMDNLQRNILEVLPHYNSCIVHHLKALEYVLAHRWLRERLQHTCFGNGPFASLLDSWSSNMVAHRWESVMGFISETLPLRGPLQRHWNAKAFCFGHTGRCSQLSSPSLASP